MYIMCYKIWLFADLTADLILCEFHELLLPGTKWLPYQLSDDIIVSHIKQDIQETVKRLWNVIFLLLIWWCSPSQHTTNIGQIHWKLKLHVQTKQSKPSIFCVVYVCAHAHTCVYAYVKFPEHADNALCNFSNSMCSGIVFFIILSMLLPFPCETLFKKKQSPGNKWCEGK